MTKCECKEEPLSPVQRKTYESKLLSFNKNSLQIKKFLTTRNATLIGLKKNAQIYKFKGKCLPGDYNGSFKVINLDDWDRLTNALKPDIYPETNTNVTNISPKISLLNTVSNSSIGNFTAQRQHSDPNCITKKASKLHQFMDNPHPTNDKPSMEIERQFIGQQNPEDYSKELGQSRIESPSQSVSGIVLNSSVGYKGDKFKIAPTLRILKSRNIAETIIRSPTASLINNNHQVSNNVPDPIDNAMEVGNCIERGKINPVSKNCSSKNVHESCEVVEKNVNRERDENQEKLQLIAKRIIPPHEETRATASIMNDAQLSSSKNGKRFLQIPSFKILPINRFHNMSKSSNHLTDSNSASSLQTNNQTKALTNLRIDLLKNSQIINVSAPATTKSTSLLNKVNSKAPEIIDLVLSESEEEDVTMLDEPEESASQGVNIEKCIEEVRRVIRDHLENKASNENHAQAERNSERTEKESCSKNKLTSDKQNENGCNYKKMNGISEVNSNRGNSLMNEDSFKISMNDQSLRHIVSNNQNLHDKCVVDKAGKAMRSLPQETFSSNQSEIGSVHLERIIPKNFQECTGSKQFTVQYIRKSRNDSIKNYNEKLSEVRETKCLENMSDKLGSNSKVAPPMLHDGETEFLQNLINDLITSNGLQFISKMSQLGLIKEHQKCKYNLHKHSERSMKLIQGKTEHFEIGVIWSCNHCSRTVSVFHGSIFEGAKASPTTIIKIIYYWCIQTHIEWLIRNLSLDYNVVSELYTRFRLVCGAALNRQMPSQLGGDWREVQISYVFMGERLIILGVLETEKNFMILKAIPIFRNEIYHTKLICLVLKKLMVQNDSEIVIDCTFQLEHQLKSLYPSLRKFEGNAATPLLPITLFLNSIWMLLKNKYSETEKRSLEGIQLILNELVWRRQCNYSPVKIFHTFIEHLLVQNATKDAQEFDKVSPLFELKINEKQNNGECIGSLQNIEPEVDNQLRVTEQSPSSFVDGANGRVPLTNQNAELLRINDNNVRDDNDKDDNNDEKDNDSKSKDESLIIIDNHHVNSEPRGETFMIVDDDDGNDINSVSRNELSHDHENDTNLILNDDLSIIIDDDINSGSRGESSIIIIDDDADDASQETRKGDKNVKNHSTNSKMIISLNEYYYGVVNDSLKKVTKFKKYPMMNCALCSSIVTDNINMMRHLFLHALSKDESSSAVERGKNYCRHCLFTSKGSMAMANHEVRCNSKPKSQTTCLICLASFESQDMLLQHMQQNHVKTEIPYKCKVCDFRISEYRYIIDHFYKIHKGDKYIQCPFCLQVFTIISGEILDQRVCIHFYNHVKKHLLIGVNRYCYKCCLSFLTERLFDEHMKKDHVLCRKKVVKYTSRGPDLGHDSSDFFIIKQRELDVDRGYKFDYQPHNLNNLPFKAKCIECQGLISVRNHFPGHFQCELCTYSTHCSIAIHNHIVDNHNTKRSTGWRGVVLSIPMICKCGYASCLGDKIAEHLVYCGETTAY